MQDKSYEEGLQLTAYFVREYLLCLATVFAQDP